MRRGFPGGSAGKEAACSAGDLGSIPGLGRSPGEEKGYPLQCSGLEPSMDCKESDTTEWLSLSLCFQATWLIHFWWLQIAWNHDFCSFHITAYPLFLFHSFLKKIFFFVFFNADNFKVFTEFATYCFCCMFWPFGHKACVISACTNQGLSWHRFHWKVKSTTGPPEKSLKWVFCRSVGVWEGCAVLSRFSCVQLFVIAWTIAVQLFVIAWTIALQAPLSMGFPRQEYWRGLPFPPPGDLPSPGIEPRSPVLAVRFFTTKSPGYSPGKGTEIVIYVFTGAAKSQTQLSN